VNYLYRDFTAGCEFTLAFRDSEENSATSTIPIFQQCAAVIDSINPVINSFQITFVEDVVAFYLAVTRSDRILRSRRKIHYSPPFGSAFALGPYPDLEISDSDAITTLVRE